MFVNDVYSSMNGFWYVDYKYADVAHGTWKYVLNMKSARIKRVINAFKKKFSGAVYPG